MSEKFLVPKVLVGAARAFGATARGLALDLAAGAAAAGENARSAAPGTPRGPATLRVRVLILADEQGQPLTTPERLSGSLDLADRVFRAHAGIRVRCQGIDTVVTPAPTTALDPRANQLLLLDDILGRTAFFREYLAARPPLAVVGDPVTVVVVRNIAGRTTGCSLGMTADWVIAKASLFEPARPLQFDETVLAHELGHALNLPHHRDRANLMYPVSSPPGQLRGTGLRRWQAAVLHANRHTVPPVRRVPGPG